RCQCRQDAGTAPDGDGARARRPPGLAAAPGAGGQPAGDARTSARERRMSQTANLPRRPGDHKFEAVNESERPWEALRFGGCQSKMLFHPRPERPTEPNAGLVRFEPGSSHPLHRHDFAQIWYILEGEFVIDGQTYGPGTMLFPPDPHYEDAMHTATGGLWLLVQYPGPSTGKPPIYDGRFNLEKRKPLAEERLGV